MEPVEKDVKEVALDSEIAKFLSITLAQENLSPAAKEKLTNLKTQYGLQSDLPGGGKAPPRPPKGGMPTPAMAANEDQEGASEELYDDVAGVISDDQYYSPMAPGGEGESTAENTATAGELNYEIMSEGAETTNTASQGDVAGGDYMAMDDDTTQDVQEDYEEPQQTERDEQSSAVQDEDYEMPGADTDYEVADKPSSMDNAPAESDNMYEGVEVVDDNVATTGSVDGVPMTGKERSGTFNLESLTKNTKPENIEGVFKKGFLNKQRKEGKKFIGSKYQKRYCVVRNHVLYYFKEKKSSKQQGYILLSGYKVAAANKKGHEFTLTHPQGQRPFQFETNSKKETEEWMSAIQAAADAPLLEDHNLQELRNKQPSDDESSLHYERSGMEKPEETVADEEDMYDDTKEDLYEEVGAIQSTISSQQSSPPIEYEVSGPVATTSTSPKPAEPSAAEPVVDEDYEVAEQSPAPAPPPPRHAKTQPPPPQNDTPAVPPPRPTKQQPVQDDTYEEADTPGGAADFPPPPADDVVLEDYEELDTFQASVPASEPPPAPSPAAVPAPVPARPPKSKPQAPATEPKPEENVPSPPDRLIAAKPAPPVPKRADEPPPCPAEEKTNDINYANVYQALWNCEASENDELEFRRGDLIYIYEKPHHDWWIGSLFKPQGYSVGLVPKDYVMEAYQFSAA